MTNKSLTLICLLALGSFSLSAEVPVPKNVVTEEGNFRQALWFGSDNVAGLGFSPLYKYNDLSLSYNGSFGSFSRAQESTKSNAVVLNAEGSYKLGGFWLWGKFGFNNIFDKGVRFNANRYEVPENNPYYYADNYSSPWKRQEYDLAVKMASPVLWNFVSFGIGIDYLTKVGAKQLDPRTENYKYKVAVAPSVVFAIGSHRIGLDGYFRYDKERSVPSINNGMFDQSVFICSGLGECQLGKVGGNDGQKTWFYKTKEYGGGLQYSFDGELALLLNLNYHKKVEDASQNPVRPKRMGSIDENILKGDFQIIFGDNKSNKFLLEGLYSSTSGIEYVQELAGEAKNQYYSVVSSNIMSHFKRLSACLSYDHLFGNDDPRGYSWKVAGKLQFDRRSSSYLFPESLFSASSAFAELEGAGHFKFKSSSLLVGVNFRYNMGLSGDYFYGGTRKDSELQNLYLWDLAYYKASYLKPGLSLAYTLNSRKVNYKFCLSGDYYKPLNFDKALSQARVDKLVAKFSFGIIF